MDNQSASNAPASNASLKCAEHPVVLVTGAGGRLGSQLARYLRARGVSIRALVRDASALPDHFDGALEWKDARQDSEALSSLVSGVTAVVHMASTGSSNLREREETHLVMPGALLDVARSASVSRFLSVSSVKAIAGESHEFPLKLDSVPAPNSDYGRFKLAAEQLVREHDANAELATYTLRLPMVYGSDSVGNFMALRTAARWNLPLPVADDNRRSVLFAENLFACIEHLLHIPVTPGHRLLQLSDGEAMSTQAFFRLIARAQGSRGLCLTLPRRWANGVAAIPVLGGIGARLLGSLQFETATLNDVPDWEMPFTTAEAVSAAIVEADRNQRLTLG